MKSADEIKKGLECCISDTYGCNEKCPYFNSLSNGVDCAVKMHADALAYIQQLEARVPRWILVEERQPEKGKTVLVAFADGYGRSGLYGGDCWSIPYSEFEVPVTKGTWWMPLPEPPEEVCHE